MAQDNNAVIAGSDVNAHNADKDLEKEKRNQNSEEFAKNHPVGVFVEKSVAGIIGVASSTVNTAAIEPTTAILESGKKAVNHIANAEHPVDEAVKMAINTKDAIAKKIDEATTPGSQNLAARDPIGDASRKLDTQIADIQNAPPVERAFQMGAIAGVAIGNVVDPLHGEGKVIANVVEIAAKTAAKEAAEQAAQNAIKDQITAAYSKTFHEKDSLLKRTLDSNDHTHMDMSRGMMIDDRTHYDNWNKEQAGKRADFYKKVIDEMPDLALALKEKDPTMQGFKQLITDPVNDHLIGIEPYAGHPARKVVRGYADFEAQAKEWGIEWKKPRTGLAGFKDEMMGGELALNKEFFAAKESVEAAEGLRLALHQDAAIHLLDPAHAMNPQLQAQATQLLNLKLEKGALTEEVRNALPEALRHLPNSEITKLQAQVTPLVSENLRLGSQAQSALPLASHPANQVTGSGMLPVAASQEEALQTVKKEFIHSLVTTTQKYQEVQKAEAPVANLVPLSPQQIAAQNKLDELANHSNPLAKAVHNVADAVGGRAGMGYNMGQIELRELELAASASDYDFAVAALKMTARKGASVVAIGVGSAITGGPVVPVIVLAGVGAARNIIKNYELGPVMQDLIQPALNKIESGMDALKTPIQNKIDAVTQQYLDFYEKLPKTADGRLTDQSATILKAVDTQVDSITITDYKVDRQPGNQR